MNLNKQAPVLSLAYIKGANRAFKNITLNGYIQNVLEWYHDEQPEVGLQFEDLVDDILNCGCDTRTANEKADRIHAWLAINWPMPID